MDAERIVKMGSLKSYPGQRGILNFFELLGNLYC